MRGLLNGAMVAPRGHPLYFEVMPALSIDDMKAAITNLDDEDRLSLTSWLNLQTMDGWDRQMQRDFSPGGRGARFLEQVKREVAEGVASGTVRPIEEGFAIRRERRS